MIIVFARIYNVVEDLRVAKLPNNIIAERSS